MLLLNAGSPAHTWTRKDVASGMLALFLVRVGHRLGNQRVRRPSAPPVSTTPTQKAAIFQWLSW